MQFRNLLKYFVGVCIEPFELIVFFLFFYYYFEIAVSHLVENALIVMKIYVVKRDMLNARRLDSIEKTFRWN